MPPKKKPLEDARKRLQEKLNNVEEQSEYICQFINDLVNKVLCICFISPVSSLTIFGGYSDLVVSMLNRTVRDIVHHAD